MLSPAEVRERWKIRQRWKNIRKNPKCDLSLTPQAVANYLSKPESELVRDRIQETLSQLALYRLEMGNFRSTSPAPEGPGDLATCEGLEAFLVPAVEGALTLSEFLKGFRGSKPENTENSEREKQDFLESILEDVRVLVDKWKDGWFSGQPYADEKRILRALLSTKRAKQDWVSITEAAAMACRVLIHLLTLKLSPSKEESESGHFKHYIGSRLEDADLLAALKNAIKFLVGAFQKGSGGTEEGPGWSWTDHAGLPATLFFTAAVVDAFAQLDLYLIRKSADGTWERTGTEDQKKLVLFYHEEAATIDQLLLYVEMSRRWVVNVVLRTISMRSGEYVEPKVLTFVGNPEAYQQYEENVKREGLSNPPMVLYNNLYALLILLWTYADWDEKGVKLDELVKNSINRALMQIVYNYKSLPTVRQALSEFPYQFWLPPGKDFFRDGYFEEEQDKKKCSYLDSGFLPLLTRLLVLFVVYGVGDRNLLEPVIRDLYVELMQNRNRQDLNHSALWSRQGVEVFSTYRAIQALTFYYAYVRGKEWIAGSSREVLTADAADVIVVKKETGQRFVFLRLSCEEAEVKRDQVGEVSPPAEAAVAPLAFQASNFDQYANDEHGFQFDITNHQGGEADVMLGATELGNDIIKDIREGKIRDIGAARLVLNALARIVREPSVNSVARERELALLQEQTEELTLGRDDA